MHHCANYQCICQLAEIGYMNTYSIWKKSSLNVRFDLMLRWNKANKNTLIKKAKSSASKKKFNYLKRFWKDQLLRHSLTFEKNLVSDARMWNRQLTFTSSHIGAAPFCQKPFRPMPVGQPSVTRQRLWVATFNGPTLSGLTFNTCSDLALILDRSYL